MCEDHAFLSALRASVEVRAHDRTIVVRADDRLGRIRDRLERGAAVVRSRLGIEPEGYRPAARRIAVDRVVVPRILRDDGESARERVRCPRLDGADRRTEHSF